MEDDLYIEGKANCIEFRCHISRDVEDIYEKVQKWLIKDFNFNPELQSIKVMYRNAILKRTQSLKEANL